MKKKILSLVLAFIMAIFVAPISLATASDDSNVVLPEGINWTEGSTVYYNGQYYNTLYDALKGVYMSSPTDVAKVYCKPNADLGTMTHGHVADDIVIYGNNAYVSGGEHDIEVDTYKYSRETGNQANDGEYLTKDITIKAYNLDGIAVWGQRNTSHTVNVIFENCQNIQRMYINGTTGPINYTVNNGSFDGKNGSHPNTSIYTNAPGNIVVNNTTFSNVGLGINLNNKSDGVQNITLTNCTFHDCAGKELSAKINSTTYGAPVRIVAQKNATSNLSLYSVDFTYSDGFEVIKENGDILIGDGRNNEGAPGKTTLYAKDTNAKLSRQMPNFYGPNGEVANPSFNHVDEFDKSKVVKYSSDNGIEFNCAHKNVSLQGAKEATCMSEGYTGDKVCADCKAVIEKGKAIAKLDHNYVDGKCSLCGSLDPNSSNPPAVNDPTDDNATDDNASIDNNDNDKNDKKDPVKTGDETNPALLLSLLAIAGASFSLLLKVRKNTK